MPFEPVAYLEVSCDGCGAETSVDVEMEELDDWGMFSVAAAAAALGRRGWECETSNSHITGATWCPSCQEGA